jgi:hypothetical protein
MFLFFQAIFKKWPTLCLIGIILPPRTRILKEDFRDGDLEVFFLLQRLHLLQTAVEAAEAVPDRIRARRPGLLIAASRWRDVCRRTRRLAEPRDFMNLSAPWLRGVGANDLGKIVLSCYGCGSFFGVILFK